MRLELREQSNEKEHFPGAPFLIRYGAQFDCIRWPLYHIGEQFRMNYSNTSAESPLMYVPLFFPSQISLIVPGLSKLNTCIGK